MKVATPRTFATSRPVAAFVLVVMSWSTVAPSMPWAAGALTAGDSTGTADSTPVLAEPPSWYRLLVHQPGVILRDGEPMLDLTGTGGRRPIPWTSFTIAVVEVPAGTHRLTLKPADPMAVPPYEGFVVTVEPGDTLTVRLGAPRVTTSPPGARVLLDGEDLGPAPVWIDPTRLPGHKVLVEMAGYQRRTVEGDTLLDLARSSGAARFELEPLTPQPLVELQPPEASSWIGRNRGLALTGSFLLLGAGVAGGIYFKNKADDFYDDYEHTGNASERDRWFNKAQQNDRASLLGWLVGEAAFFATFFLLIYQPPRGLVTNPDATPAPVEPVARSRAALAPIAPDGEPGVTIGFVHEF
ncbi:MAG TPA: PEGA domain-containing protein [Candidatus Eisenbacteria bacterium]